MAGDRPRHDAKFSPAVLEILREVLNDPAAPVPGPLVDPFAGVGLLDEVGREDLWGIELEPEFAGARDWIVCGDALDPTVYPAKVGAVVTSPTYGNRMADQYLGPVCGICLGAGEAPDERGNCRGCAGSGRNGSGRYGYAISLGRRPSPGSSAGMQWGKSYRSFHRTWLRTIGGLVEPGPRRLVLNMSDHYRDRQRVYVVNWWIRAAGDYGFRFVEAISADTARIGHGQNQEKRAEAEMVIVFDFLSRDWKEE